MDHGIPPTSPATPAASALRTRDAHGSVVGRVPEINAIRQQVDAASRGQLAAVSLEGEPGIGKSRLLIATAQVAAERGFVTISATADEEFRGPFMVARAILRSREAREAGDGAAGDDLTRALDAISGSDDPGLATLAPDEKLLRVFDLAAVALRTIAATTPLALILDDMHWADDDSVRMLRYVVRSAADLPILVATAVRTEELTDTETAPLLADMERMGMLRRLSIGRMSRAESVELLRSVLGSAIDESSATTMHAQGEGVPFILAEIARTYREAGLIQQIDGVWTLAKNAGSMVPSAVRTLIDRRAARLPAPTRAVLAEAAVIGRSFSIRDLLAVREQLGEAATGATPALAEVLRPAVEAGLIAEVDTASAADYRFAHEQVREFVMSTLTAARRRELHAAIVDLLTSGADVPEESLPILARHALAAGDRDRAARYTIDAAHAALAARAPEEVLRITDLALPVVSAPQDRVALLTARDDAFEMLRRPADRVEGLAELTALTEALGDEHLELQAMLRRAAALRLSDEPDRAIPLAVEVRSTAASRGDRRAELAACLELGQAHLGKPLGESFNPPGPEVDYDQAEEAFTCACELARELDDTPALAAATRELGVLTAGRVRTRFIAYEQEHGVEEALTLLAAGATPDDIIQSLEIAPLYRHATTLLERAVELFEQVGDQRGLMSSIIALAYIRFAPDIHLNASARRIEDIRHLATQLASLSRESERDRAEAQMLYGVHVFARTKLVLDLAIDRGAEAFEKAHLLGDRSLEFLAAGGVATVHLELGDPDEARRWLDRAAAAAVADPTPFKSRQLALWRGSCCAVAEDPVGMRAHLEQAVRHAEEQRRPAGRCEALAHYASEAARLGERIGDADLLALAEQRAAEAKVISASLPGHPLWGARADAALVRVSLARGDVQAAAEAARSATAALEAARLEDPNLDVLLPAARAILAGGSEEERAETIGMLRIGLVLIAQRIHDEDVRVRWFLGPVGRELTDITGSLDDEALVRQTEGDALEDHEAELLKLLVEGRTNAQIAEILGLTEAALSRRLAEFYARIGIGSRAEATAFAFRERAI